MISSSTILIDPWIVLDETKIHSLSDRMPLSPIEIDYEAIYLACSTYSFSSINWVDKSLDYGTSSDRFSCALSTDESIMEIVILGDAPWDDHQHHSPLPDSIDHNLSDVYLSNIIESFTNYVSIHKVDSKRNLTNIKETNPPDISLKLVIF